MKVFTSITGDKDKLRENQTEGDYIAFTEQESEIWETRAPCKLFKDRRRNYKPPKILSHLYLDTDVSLWINGSIELNISPEQLREEWLNKETDIALYHHFSGRSIYEELDLEKNKKKDNLDRLEALEAFYKDKGVPEIEMGECGVIMRRHNEKVARFNNEWFALVTKFTQRDQTIFAYLDWKHDEVNTNYIEGDFRTSDKFNFYKHKDPDPTQ